MQLRTILPFMVIGLAAGCGGDSGPGEGPGTGGTGTASGGSPSSTGGTPSTTGGTVATTGGSSTTGGSVSTGGNVTTGGMATVTGGSTGTGGSSATGGSATTGGSAGKSGTGGTAGKSGTGGSATGGKGGAGGATGGTANTGGTGNVGGGFLPGGAGGLPALPPVDCGGKAAVIENAGPPANRVNYAIIGDGYLQSELDTTYITHIQSAMTKRFNDPIGQVYLRYRKFVNICAIKFPSTGAICGSSALGCCGNDSSRLASCNNSAANTAISANLPASFEVDWRAVVLNGSSWWNTGAALMLWSGGNKDAAGAALHEGGHGFHQLADEYGDCGSNWINNTNDNVMAQGKWDLWLNYSQTPGTGMQGFFSCGGSAWRPTSNSMMNSLFGNNANTSFNAISREKMIMDIWRIIQTPWDSLTPPAGAVTNPPTLAVNVIDPAVISVDWSVDGKLVAVNGGPTYAIGAAGLAPGAHMVTARAYDNAGTDLVRYRTGGTQYNRQYWGPPTSANMMRGSERTATWTVTIQ